MSGSSVLDGESLDGAQDVPLAPVRGPDLRRNLPPRLFPKRPSRFAAKFWFAIAIIGACWAAIAASPGWMVTAVAIVVTNLFEGVLLGLLLAVAKTAWETSHVHIQVDDPGIGPVRVRILGNATFLRLPKMLDALEALPVDRPIELDLTALRHQDHASSTALLGWAERHNALSSEPVHLSRPS